MVLFWLGGINCKQFKALRYISLDNLNNKNSFLGLGLHIDTCLLIIGSNNKLNAVRSNLKL